MTPLRAGLDIVALSAMNGYARPAHAASFNSYPRTVRTGHFAWHTTVLAMVHGK